MTWLRVLGARLFALTHRSQLEADMEEELRFHLAMRTQENVRRGLSPAEAARQAGRQFGNVNLIKDAWRDISGGGAVETIWRDVRFAARMLLKNRAFAFIAVLALGLGIGANTALFTVVGNVLLRPLAYPNAGQLMSVWLREDRNPEKQVRFTYPDFADVRAQNRWFDGLGAFFPCSFVVAGGEGETMHAEGAYVTPEALRLLDVQPILGRLFTESEDEPGNRSAIISHALWQERFAGAPDAVGAPLFVDGYEYQIVGVMPADFQFPVANDPAQVWTTFARDREPSPSGEPPHAAHRDAHYVQVLGRLKHNVSREDAAVGVSAVLASLAAKYPETNRRFDSGAVVPWLAQITNKVRPALLLLIGAALCLLCIACVNVANLLLGRATTRQKEMAIRAAVGAGRSRILRQLLAESLLLAAIGGCLGLLLALVGTHYIVAMLPPDFPRSSEIAPDRAMLIFAVIATIVTSCVFGFAPAWYAARCDLARVLNDCSRICGQSPRGRRLRNVLVVTELVLAFILLAGACSLIRSLWTLENAAPGFNPRELVTARLSLPENGSTREPLRATRFFRELFRRLADVKEIKSASAVYPLPFTPQWLTDVEISGRPILKADLPRARPYIVTPNFFQTMQIGMRKGRDFDDRDDRNAPRVVIVNEALVRAFFPNEDPLGKRIRPGLSDDLEPIPVREIIGVVADAKSDDLASEPMPAVYMPHAQCPAVDMTLVLRGHGSADQMIGATRHAVTAIDMSVVLYQSHEMEHYLKVAVAQARLNSILMAIFASVAVVLTAIGVYGVMAYAVVQRTHEIGIRLALGAQKLTIFRLVVGQGVRLILWSLLFGIVCSVCAMPFLRPVINGDSISTPVIVVLVASLLGTIALVACWLPAQRAAEFDPLHAIGQR